VPEGSSQQIGRLAVDRGLITATQLREALEEFNVRKAAGGEVPLGEVLVELEFLTRRQLESLLDQQGGETRSRAQPIPGYELIKKLGEGGMAATYLARQATMDRLVAIKIMRKNLARDASFISRFEREARLAGSLNHVNIVGVHDVGEGGGFHYLAMEYVEGRSAGELVPEGGAMGEELALHVALQVARALDYASGHGIVHRDIKPDNILVTVDRIAKVCDFGLARHTGQETRLTQTGMAMGTPHYISPEQARGEKDVDVRSDIYSLGASLYHFVTGEPPFSGSSAMVVVTKHITEQLPWPQDVNPDVSENVCRVIMKMMAKDREDRYATPAELIGDLELVIDGKPPEAASLAADRSSVGMRGALGVKRPPRRRLQRVREDAGTVGRLLEPAGRPRKTPAALRAGLAAAALLVAALAGWALLGGSGAEASAEKAWRERVLPAVAEKLSREEALALRDALTVFGARHGETAFARAKAAEIERLKSLAETALTGKGPSPASEDQLREMYELADSLWKKDPDDFAAAAARFEKVRAAAGGSKYELMADEAIDRVKAAEAKAAEGAFAALEGRASRLTAAGDYDGALAELGRPPEKFAKLVADALEAERKRVRETAAFVLGKAITAAEQFGRDGQPEKGLAELEKVKSAKYAPMAAKVAALSERLKKESADVAGKQARQREAEARRAVEAVLSGFDELALAGKWRDAAGHVAAEKKKLKAEVLAAAPPELAAVEILAARLVSVQQEGAAAAKRLVGTRVEIRTAAGRTVRGDLEGLTADSFKVTVRFRIGDNWGQSVREVKFAELAPGEIDRLLPRPKPVDADGHVAAALLALSRKDTAGAEKALAAAGGHPLAPRYARRLDVLKLGAKEAAAKRAWAEKIAALIRPKYTRGTAEALVAALDLYVETHGGTKFAEGKAQEIAALRRAAQLALGSIVYTKWPFDAAEAVRRQKEVAEALKIPVVRTLDLGDNVKLELVLIPAGEFMMGGKHTPEEIFRRGERREEIQWATAKVIDCYRREHPRHRVRMSRPYYLGRTEVTQRQWKQVMGTAPSKFKGPLLPVEQVNWGGCREFARKLGAVAPGNLTFGLPTEAEWEHACRAGTDGSFFFGEKIATDRVNYDGNRVWDGYRGGRRGKTLPAGSFKPNAWGLHDMHGNVYEWCADWFGPYIAGKQTDPRGPAEGTRRVVRGGSWYWPPAFMRSAFREHHLPTDRDDCYGLRVLGVIPGPGAEPQSVGPAQGEMAVVGFVLVDGDTEKPIPGYDPLPDNCLLRLSKLPTRNLGILARVQGNVKSVSFWQGGRFRHTEKNPPFVLTGDAGGGPKKWNTGPGSHTLKAVPYGIPASSSERPGVGPPGKSLQITIRLAE
jgi:serine/threonine-protein kinase